MIKTITKETITEFVKLTSEPAVGKDNAFYIKCILDNTAYWWKINWGTTNTSVLTTNLSEATQFYIYNTNYKYLCAIKPGSTGIEYVRAYTGGASTITPGTYNISTGSRNPSISYRQNWKLTDFSNMYFSLGYSANIYGQVASLSKDNDNMLNNTINNTTSASTTSLPLEFWVNRTETIITNYPIASNDFIFEKANFSTDDCYPSLKRYSGNWTNYPSKYNGIYSSLVNNTSSQLSNISKYLVFDGVKDELALTTAAESSTAKAHDFTIYNGLSDVYFQTDVSLGPSNLTFILNLYIEDTLVNTKTIGKYDANPATTTLIKTRCFPIITGSTWNNNLAVDANNRIILNVDYSAPDTDTRVWTFQLRTNSN